MPRIFKRRPFPRFARSPEFPTVGLGIEWPPLAATVEPDVVHEIITNVIEVPVPGEEPDVIVGRASDFIISTSGPLSIGYEIASSEVATASSVAWPAANRALFVPFQVSEQVTVYQTFLINGATVSGNVDLGVYKEDGTYIISTGATAQSGTNALQAIDITDTMFGPGRFYMALSISNTTATVFGYLTFDGPTATGFGMFQQASAHPLPTTSATFASCSSSTVPRFGIVCRSQSI